MKLKLVRYIYFLNNCNPASIASNPRKGTSEKNKFSEYNVLIYQASWRYLFTESYTTKKSLYP